MVTGKARRSRDGKPTARRWASAALLIGAVVTGPARAGAEAELGIGRVGWTWQAWRSELGAVAPPNQDSGQVPVAATPAGPDKIAYVQFELPAADDPAIALKMVLDPDAANVNPETAALRTCLVMEDWPGQSPIAWDQRPPTDCTIGTEGRYLPEEGAFVFENMAGLIPRWRGGSNFGVSVEPAPGQAVPFQVYFKSPAAGGVLAWATEPISAEPPPVPAQEDGSSAGPASAAPVADDPPAPGADAAPPGDGVGVDFAFVPDAETGDGVLGSVTDDTRLMPASESDVAEGPGSVPAEAGVGAEVMPQAFGPVRSTEAHASLDWLQAGLMFLIVAPVVGRVLAAAQREARREERCEL